MTDLPVVRVYDSPGQAQRALDALRRWGFEAERIVVLTGSTPSSATKAPPTRKKKAKS